MGFVQVENRAFARQPCCMAGTMMNEKFSFLMQNIFILPTMQHGCCVKPYITKLIYLKSSWMVLCYKMELFTSLT